MTSKEAKEEEKFRTDQSIRLSRFGKDNVPRSVAEWTMMRSLVIKESIFNGINGTRHNWSS